MNVKALEDELDALIDLKEQAQDEHEDDFVDGRIHALLKSLLPMQHQEMRRFESMVPVGKTDLF